MILVLLSCVTYNSKSEVIKKVIRTLGLGKLVRRRRVDAHLKKKKEKRKRLALEK